MLIFCVKQTHQMPTQNLSLATKIVKNFGIDVTLKCSLLEKHENFNRNASVSWWIKKTCKASCWNQQEKDDEWEEIDCHGPCKVSLVLDDENSKNGFYLCKIFPYQISNQNVLQIEVTKSFEIELFGKKNLTYFKRIIIIHIYCFIQIHCIPLHHLRFWMIRQQISMFQ
jgi:hypothetical protein